MSRYSEICSELENQKKRWVVTGVAGFIGSALLEKLLELGQDVVGLDNFATGKRSNIDEVLALPTSKGSFELIEGDICDLAACQRAVAGADYVLHQAALGSVPRSIEDPLSSHLANVDGMVNMLVAARDAKVSRFVYASSSSVYGDHPGLPKVEQELGRVLSPYAATKMIDEIYSGVFQDSYNLECIGLRYFNVFGRRQDPEGAYAAVIPKWIGLLLQGDPCLIFGDSSFSRDFLYIDNAVQANLLAATGPAEATNRAYNVGCGGRTDLSELFELIRDGLVPISNVDPEARPTIAEPRLGDIPHSQADISAIQVGLGYEPSHDVRQGMAETVAWFAKNA